MSDSSASEDPTKTMPSTAGERFGVVGANGTYAVWDKTHGLRWGRLDPRVRAEAAVKFALDNWETVFERPEE